MRALLIALLFVFVVSPIAPNQMPGWNIPHRSWAQTMFPPPVIQPISPPGYVYPSQLWTFPAQP
jgi:hypothetical protein